LRARDAQHDDLIRPSAVRPLAVSALAALALDMGAAGFLSGTDDICSTAVLTFYFAGTFTRPRARTPAPNVINVAHFSVGARTRI
jgi:hypothetical protein